MIYGERSLCGMDPNKRNGKPNDYMRMTALASVILIIICLVLVIRDSDVSSVFRHFISYGFFFFVDA